jgi:hypothetical protein
MDFECKGAGSMMDVRWDGREVVVRLRDDVWSMLEPGTLCLTRKQAQTLLLHLGELSRVPDFEQEPEDG